MDGVFTLLKDRAEPWLSCDWTCWDTDPNYSAKCGLWLLLLFLCYGALQLHSILQRKSKDSQKGRAKRRRKGGALRGWKAWQKEEETRKLLSILRSPLGQYHDTTCFCQLLCSNPFCEVCERATAEVDRLLSGEPLEDAAPPWSSLTSTVSETESLITLTSDLSADPEAELIPDPLPEPSSPFTILSPDRMTPLVDFLSPSPPDNNLPPESFLPLTPSQLPMDYFTSQPPAFSPLPPYHTQRVDPLLQPRAALSPNSIFVLHPTISQDTNVATNLSHAMNPTDSFACYHAPPTLCASPPPDCASTVTQSQSISIVLKPLPENSSPDSPAGLTAYVPTITGTDPSNLPLSEFSWWQAHAQDFSPSTLAQCDFQPGLLTVHSPEVPLGGDIITNYVEAGSLSFLSPDVLDFLERQVKKRGDFLMWKEKENKKRSFLKQLRAHFQLNSSGKMLDSIADKQDTAASLHFWSTEGKQEELIHQQSPYPNTLGGHLQRKYIQLFWGPPFLHSESLMPAVLVSGGCLSIFVFNRISSAPVTQIEDGESPLLSHPLSLSLSERKLQTLPETLPDSQPPHLTQVQSQAHLKSALPNLPPSVSAHIKSCGVSFHRLQNEAQSFDPTEINHLEWHVLQKQQDGLWGLPTVVQRSQEAFCSPAPNSPQYHQASRVHVPVSIIPGHFPLNSEVQKKLEHHLRKRIIQHRWGLPRRIHDSLSLMKPPGELSEVSESKSSYGLSWLSVFKRENNKHLKSVGSSLSESVYEKSSETLPLEEGQGHSLENGPKDHLLKDSEVSFVKDLESDSENDLEGHMVSLSGNNSRASGVSLEQRKLENTLKVHLSKKFEQINEGRIPVAVHSSWHAVKQTLPPPAKSHTQMKQQNLTQWVAGDSCLNTSQELSFIDSRTQEILEAHVKRLDLRRLWGLPNKILESIEILKLKEASSCSSLHPNIPYAITIVSGMDSKAKASETFTKSTQTFQVDEVLTTTSVPIVDHSLPATSPVGKEGQGTKRRSPSDVNHELAQDFQTTEDGSQLLLPLTYSTEDNVSQSETVTTNRCSPELPISQDRAGHEPRDQQVSFSDRGEMLQDKGMAEKNLKQFSIFTVSREIFKAEELYAEQSQMSDASEKINMDTSEMEIPLTTECPPSPKTPVPHDPDISHLKKQLLDELKCKVESKEHRQSQGYPTDMSLASENLSLKAPLTHAQSISSGNVSESQVLHVNLEDKGMQRQEPWVPKHVLRKCQEKNFPPAAKRVNPQRLATREFGEGDAGLGTARVRKSHRAQVRKLEQTLGSKSSQCPLQMQQSLSESLFRKTVKHLLQWLHPRTQHKEQGSFLEKRSSMSASAQSRGPVKSRARVAEAQNFLADIRKFVEEKMRRRHGGDITCSQMSLPSLKKFEKIQYNARLKTQAEPIKGHPFNYRAPFHKVTNTEGNSQKAVCVGQSFPTCARDRNTHPQKVVGCKDQLLCQSYPLSTTIKELEFLPSPTCMPQECQVPQAAFTTAEGSHRDFSFVLRQEMLHQCSQGGKFPPKNNSFLVENTDSLQ
ncbi:spermatogenesis-associated protein 31D3-like [Tamandua tetradactyla]|uniref:spermatogenesis-associated protein 31D3-like n=1 Tax=Tamandua tetradactyla TaxID=48850 RepID=UPI004053A413